MEEQKYIVHFAEMVQPVVAASAEIDGEVLLLTKADGTLSAFFDLSLVEKWYLATKPEIVHRPPRSGGDSRI